MLEHANCGLSKFRRLDLMVNSFLALVSSRRKKGSWDTEYELRQMWSSVTLGVKIIQTTGKLWASQKTGMQKYTIYVKWTSEWNQFNSIRITFNFFGACDFKNIELARSRYPTSLRTPIARLFFAISFAKDSWRRNNTQRRDAGTPRGCTASFSRSEKGKGKWTEFAERPDGPDGRTLNKVDAGENNCVITFLINFYLCTTCKLHAETI